MSNEANLNKDPDVARERGKLGGRPKGAKGVKATIKKYLSKEINHTNPLSQDKESLTVQEHIILTAIAKAISGDDRSREDILNRLYGKPTERQKTSVNVHGDLKEILSGAKAKIDELFGK